MRDDLVRRIGSVLLAEPYLSARQISARIGSEEISPRLVNSVLYSQRTVFEILGPEQPPIWAIREDATATVESWEITTPGESVDPAAGGAGAEQESGSSAHPEPSIEYSGPPLRAWQREALVNWTRNGHRSVVEAVTGSGKTAVGLWAAAHALRQRRQAVVLVPGVDLQSQWYRALREALPSARIERMGGGTADPGAGRWDILVVTVQTAAGTKRFGLGFEPGNALLIADEVHRYGANSYAKALTGDFEWRLGLTATLERSDDAVEQTLLPYFEHLVAGCNYLRAQADGILAPVKVALVGVDFSPRERARFELADDLVRRERTTLVDTYGAPEEPFGEFMAYVQQLAKDRGSAARHANKYLKNFDERRAVLAECRAKLDLMRELPAPVLGRTQSIVFTERSATAGQVAQVFSESGVPTGVLRSGLRPAEREEIMTEFRAQRLRALAAPRVLDEGVDVPDAQLGIVLAASRTRRQMIQRMGRVIRPKADGRTAVFVLTFVRGTPEDPATGAHDTFLGELTGIATETRQVVAEELAPTLRKWLSSAGPSPAAMRRSIAVPVPPPAQTPPQPQEGTSLSSDGAGDVTAPGTETAGPLFSAITVDSALPEPAGSAKPVFLPPPPRQPARPVFAEPNIRTDGAVAADTVKVPSGGAADDTARASVDADSATETSNTGAEYTQAGGSVSAEELEDAAGSAVRDGSRLPAVSISSASSSAEIKAALTGLDGVATLREIGDALGVGNMQAIRSRALAATRRHGIAGQATPDSGDMVLLGTECGGLLRDRRYALDAVIEWAVRSPDPLWEFTELVQKLGPVRIPLPRLIQILAMLRGVTVLELVRTAGR
ncbi:DEAD/DEAH box helicase [Nocardia sp. NPDC019395]|uniref:DEAD/DEAH box helicase n=1 Tax=Nocardia sp. NPDC019395 TaxID=3154686 RepID=UPI0033E97BD6